MTDIGVSNLPQKTLFAGIGCIIIRFFIPLRKKTLLKQSITQHQNKHIIMLYRLRKCI